MENPDKSKNSKVLSRREFLQKMSHYLPAFVLWINGCGLDLEKRNKNQITPKESENDNDFVPAYIELHKTRELKKRGEELWDIMKECMLCPRTCLENRIEGKTGVCQATSELEVSSYNPHFGEETPLVGKGGSGTIFFTNCGLRCVFCQNWQISIAGYGYKQSIEKLANMMLSLQKTGCHNINVVTPTHYSPHIVKALDVAAKKGLNIPLVYNTSGYERVEILEKLDGIVDIYLPDFKYFDSKMANKYSSEAIDYPEMAKKALLEMHRQVGVAKPNDNGIMERGLMIRHLVMPNNVGGTNDIIQWIADNLTKDTYVNIMSQYRPMYKADEYPDISRGLYQSEYDEAINYAKKAGLTNLDKP